MLSLYHNQLFVVYCQTKLNEIFSRVQAFLQILSNMSFEAAVGDGTRVDSNKRKFKRVDMGKDQN